MNHSTWRGWLMRRARLWSGVTLGMLALAMVGGSALVGTSTDAEQAGDGGHAVVNHGRCVSQAAHAAKEAGLKGPAKGAFMAAIAADESMVADKGEVDCDFSEALSDALAAQAATEGDSAGPGKSAEAKAKAEAKRAEHAEARAARWEAKEARHAAKAAAKAARVAAEDPAAD